MLFESDVEWSAGFTYVTAAAITVYLVDAASGVGVGLITATSSISSKDVFQSLIRIKGDINTGSFSEESTDLMAYLALVWNVDSDGCRLRFRGTVVLMLESCGYSLFNELFRVSIQGDESSLEVVDFVLEVGWVTDGFGTSG